MQVGVCLAPDTDIQNNESILLLLSKKYSVETMSLTDSNKDNLPLVDMVDLLAVNPGFAGNICIDVYVYKYDIYTYVRI